MLGIGLKKQYSEKIHGKDLFGRAGKIVGARYLV